jgi:hypothetical protein
MEESIKVILRRTAYLGIAGYFSFAAFLIHALFLGVGLPYEVVSYLFLALAAFLLIAGVRLNRHGSVAAAWLTLGTTYTLLFLTNPMASPLSLFVIIALLLFCFEMNRLHLILRPVVRTQTLVEGSPSERKVSALLLRQFLTNSGVILATLIASLVTAYLSLDVVLNPPIFGAAILLSLGLIGIVAVVVRMAHT